MPQRIRKKAKRHNIDNDSSLNSDFQTSNPRTSIGNDFEEEFHEEKGTQIIDDIYMPPPPIQPTNLEDQTGQRLIIETIDIINFKSYGGHSVLGPFYKSFNSIVGPNGSGKSNVIDSMLFVFGYRAQKLRSNKISAIIHNSETMPNCDFARVNVNFIMIDDKGDQNQDIIPNTRFSVSRVVHKDNSSYYMIDNRRVMFRDVSKKLQDFGIDLRYNRFLILQGEVEQISLMKPKADNNNNVGMLEYLEDIIGTSRYKDPIEKLSVKYSELNQERTHCVNRVNMSQKELKVVQQAKDEAVHVLKLENQKKIEKAKLIQCQMHKMKKKLAKHEAEYKEFEDQMNSMNQEEKDISNEKIQLDQEEKRIAAEYNEIKKKSEKLKEQIQELEKTDYYLNSKYKSAKTKLKKLKAQIVKDQQLLETFEKTPIKSDETIELLEQSKTKIELELKELEELIQKETVDSQQECSDLIKERDEYNQQLIKFKDEQKEKLNQKNEAYNQFMIQKQKIDSTQDKYDQLQSKIKSINDDICEKTKIIERYQQEIPLEKAKLKESYKKYEKLEQKRANQTLIINQKSEELYSLKESLNKNQTRDSIRNALMEEKRKGNLPGIFGRLGELGAIDKMYDVAVTTACGQLNNFVVDTIENAERCVNFLKRNSLPSATFIALDKLRVQWRDNVSYPENIPRLFDLIRINDERLRPAFYYALGETLVAEDIDQAKRITKNARYRIVTLNGGMIQFDGAMTGGGKPKSGGMGQSIAPDFQASEEECIKLKEEIDEMVEEQKKLDYEIDGIREDINKIEKDLKFLEDKLNGLPLDVSENKARLEQLEKHLLEQKKELEKNKNNTELEKTKNAYEKAKAIYEKEMEKMDDIQEKMTKIDEEIKDKLNQRLEPLKKKRKELEKRLKSNQTELSELLAANTANELNLTKAKETLANTEKSIQETEAEIEDIKQQISELEIKAKDINAQFEQAQQEYQTKVEELKEINKKVHEADAKLKLITNQKLDLQIEAEKRFKTLREKQEKVARYRNELESIKLNEIDDPDEDNKEETVDTNTSNDETEEMMDIDEVPETPPDGDAPKNVQQNKNKKPDSTQLPEWSEEELEQFDPEEIDRKVKSIESELEKLKPNFTAIEEYRKKREEYNAKMADLYQITTKRDLYMDHLKETKQRRLKEFKTGFMTIARKLKELYRTLTLGGDADLEFIDSLDPFSEGINFAVRPNKKSWKNNINLSGGEKTLASLALIFALHYYKPSPLYIMDEIDAALDFKNVSIIANYIKNRTKNTQFLIISLRNNMYELADRLIGIYKTHNITKSIPFDPNAFEQKLKQSQSQQPQQQLPQRILSV